MANDTRIILTNARLVADPQHETSKNGKTYMRLRFAVTPYRKTQAGIQNEETQWWTVLEFDENRINRIQNSLHKGVSCRIEGTYVPSVYTDRNGQAKPELSINHATITMNLSKPKQDEWEPEF